ncbi:hypothetical protein J3Q64DRAFT_1618064, partial [Phycomyces blakesleeanus]
QALIKRYPDGSQEIIVPQTLTPDQERYQFPPRSRFLKKLANKTSKQYQHQQQKQIQHQNQNQHQHQHRHQHQINHTSSFDLQPRIEKNRAVAHWITEIERSKALLQSSCSAVSQPQQSPHLFSSAILSTPARAVSSNTNLLPPDDSVRTHYVRCNLLQTTFSPQHSPQVAASDIQEFWRGYQERARVMRRHSITLPPQPSSSGLGPILGMINIVRALQNSLKEQEQKSKIRIAHLEKTLREEQQWRQDTERRQQQ